jgi:hypothetical protein
VAASGSKWEQVGIVMDVLEHRQDDSDLASKPPEPITGHSGDGLARPGPPSHVIAGLERVLEQAHVVADKETTETTEATATTAMAPMTMTTTTTAANRLDSSTCSNTAEPARASTWAATVGTWVGIFGQAGLRHTGHCHDCSTGRWESSSRDGHGDAAVRRCGQDCDMGRSSRRPRPSGLGSLE